ncbi:TlpA family protein disulfide reductase [Bizionia gelidisalsuginis]|uniref:TlpA family protein disulfide reductase n=1 Tax=Bizionia gelidisalsuginis TaxID=291188 RepID=A0ABY3MBP0_9FLAO|nr:TlpA disulfide reductase family protein [Bizionia gelidisalsuginis]TYC14212.1 TlpA family protein disulfide reductase [Bizionia gelidisalsuginis]
MKTNNKNTTKKTWIQYGVFALIAITLYATGLHTEVIGFAQRGLLATGVMNPDVKELVMAQESANTTDAPNLTKADMNFNLLDSDGNVTSLKELKGKVIFINLWATWCPPCIAEMPSINTLYDTVGDDVAFVMLSLDRKFETAKAFNERKGYGFPIYAPADAIPEMYNTNSIPSTYVIDAKGNLALTHRGMADYSDPEFIEFLYSLK